MFKIFSTKKQATKQAPTLTQEDGKLFEDLELFEELSDAELMAVVGGLDVSPQLGLVQGTLNKPCIGLPAKINAQSLVALINVGVQDINVLSSPQNQQCVENSTQAKGDEPLSHILSNIPVLSGNASAGS